HHHHRLSCVVLPTHLQTHPSQCPSAFSLLAGSLAGPHTCIWQKMSQIPHNWQPFSVSGATTVSVKEQRTPPSPPYGIIDGKKYCMYIVRKAKGNVLRRGNDDTSQILKR